MLLSTWLKKAGFTSDPFDNTIAEYEQDLPQYYVEPKRWDQLADTGSSLKGAIIHAMPGGGKSALCRMLADHLSKGNPRLLVVTISDWRQIDIPQSSSDPDFNAALPHCSIISTAVDNALRRPEPPPLNSNAQLAAPTRQDAVDILKQLAGHVRAQHYDACYVLLDGIDDHLSKTETLPAEAADLIAPLTSRRLLHTIDGFVLRYFLSTEVLQELRKRKRIRQEVFEEFQLTWETAKLKAILQERLTFSSERHKQSLNEIVKTEASKVIDIDDFLVVKANGNPRNLLESARSLVRYAAESATAEHWELTQQNLEIFYRQAFDVEHPTQPQQPLGTADQHALTDHLIRNYLIPPPSADWFMKLTNLIANMHSDVQRELPAYSHYTMQDAAMHLIRTINTFRYTLEPRDHPLVVLIGALRGSYEGKDDPTLKRIEGVAWENLQEDWRRRIPSASGST